MSERAAGQVRDETRGDRAGEPHPDNAAVRPVARENLLKQNGLAADLVACTVNSGLKFERQDLPGKAP